MTSLFRSEALQHHHRRLFGDVSLAQPMSIYVSVSLISVLFVLLLVFLLSAEHHRKERIFGHLVPSKGMLRVFAERSGRVSRTFVREGDLVAKGDPLVLIWNPQNSGSVYLEESLKQQLEVQIRSLEQSMSDHKQLFDKEMLGALSLAKELQEKIAHTRHQIRLSQEQLALHGGRLRSARKLFETGYLSKFDFNLSEAQFLEHQQSADQMHGRLMTVQQELGLVQQRIRELPNRYALTTNQFVRQKSELQLQVEKTQSSFKSMMVASREGRVTSVQVNEGQDLVAGEPMLSIMPTGARLIADLYLPTRSAGFVDIGHQTRLRFDAFPYQKFGLIDAEVIQIDKSLLIPERYPQINLSEPVYRVRAHLAQQSLSLNEEQFPLKVGMQLEADVLLEKRRLLDWVLAPLFGLMARIG